MPNATDGLASIGLPTRRLSVEGTQRTEAGTRLYTHVSRLYIRFSSWSSGLPFGGGRVARVGVEWWEWRGRRRGVCIPRPASGVRRRPWW